MELNFNDGLCATQITLNNRETVIFALLCERLMTEEKIWDIMPSFCEEELLEDVLALGKEFRDVIPTHSRKHIFSAPSEI
jgi:hypothetical protein